MVADATLEAEYETFLRAYLNASSRRKAERLAGIASGYRRCLEMTDHLDVATAVEDRLHEEAMMHTGLLANVQRAKVLVKMHNITG
jgi:hypothetical protein